MEMKLTRHVTYKALLAVYTVMVKKDLSSFPSICRLLMQWGVIAYWNDLNENFPELKEFYKKKYGVEPASDKYWWANDILGVANRIDMLRHVIEQTRPVGKQPLRDAGFDTCGDYLSDHASDEKECEPEPERYKMYKMAHSYYNAILYEGAKLKTVGFCEYFRDVYGKNSKIMFTSLFPELAEYYEIEHGHPPPSNTFWWGFGIYGLEKRINALKYAVKEMDDKAKKEPAKSNKITLGREAIKEIIKAFGIDDKNVRSISIHMSVDDAVKIEIDRFGAFDVTDAKNTLEKFYLAK